MIVSEYDVVKYISENVDIYTCIVDDRKLVLRSDGTELYIDGLIGKVYSIEDTLIEIKSLTSGHETLIKGRLPQELIDVIKQQCLERVVQGELKALLPAAFDMVDHYRNGPSPTPDVRIRMHVLKNIDYSQPHKGHVIINPLENGPTVSNGDFIKGYVYVWNADGPSIKYETVQGWRYKEVQLEDLGVNDIICTEWLQVMCNKHQLSCIAGGSPEPSTVRHSSRIIGVT